MSRDLILNIMASSIEVAVGAGVLFFLSTLWRDSRIAILR
jgi:hypothetical protein